MPKMQAAQQREEKKERACVLGGWWVVGGSLSRPSLVPASPGANSSTVTRQATSLLRGDAPLWSAR